MEQYNKVVLELIETIKKSIELSRKTVEALEDVFEDHEIIRKTNV